MLLGLIHKPLVTPLLLSLISNHLHIQLHGTDINKHIHDRLQSIADSFRTTDELSPDPNTNRGPLYTGSATMPAAAKSFWPVFASFMGKTLCYLVYPHELTHVSLVSHIYRHSRSRRRKDDRQRPNKVATTNGSRQRCNVWVRCITPREVARRALIVLGLLSAVHFLPQPPRIAHLPASAFRTHWSSTALETLESL